MAYQMISLHCKPLVSQLQYNCVTREHGESETNDKDGNEIERLRSELSVTVVDLENLLRRFDDQSQEPTKLLQRRISQLRWLRERARISA
jgi:hypothetical protein